LIRSERNKIRKQSLEITGVGEPEVIKTQLDLKFDRWSDFDNEKTEEGYQGMEVVMGLDWMGVQEHEYKDWIKEQQMKEYAMVDLAKIKEGSTKKVKMSWRERRRERKTKRKAEKERKKR
jgi:hypothetical protein